MLTSSERTGRDGATHSPWSAVPEIPWHRPSGSTRSWHAGVGADAAAVERMLHHAPDDLRLTLDSLEPMDGDLPTILGTWRQRIAPALAAAGIELGWQVQEVAAVPGLEASGVMHLFRCLQEIIANVLKHARADRVVVRTWQDERGVVLSVADNGMGLGDDRDRSSLVMGRGLCNSRFRAAEIGAEVEFLKGRPGTVVSFRFPPA